MIRFFSIIYVINLLFLQGCGNWKSLILKNNSQGVSSASYPKLYFKLQNHSVSGSTSTISVKNNDNSEIAQIKLNDLSISLDDIRLHTDDFPGQESVARNVSFSVLENKLTPSINSNQIPNPDSGFKNMSLINLSIMLDGVLTSGEEEHNIVYTIDFSKETFLYNDEQFSSMSLPEGENTLILEVNIEKWFRFNISSTFSDAAIKTELRSLGSGTEVQKDLTAQLLKNIQRSFVFGIDKNLDGKLEANESNNSSYFSSEH